jgi:mannose-6-phosphate isomerase class I
MTPHEEHGKENDKINHPLIQMDKEDVIVAGWPGFGSFVGESIQRILETRDTPCIIGLDGYTGTDWQTVKGQLENSFDEKRISYDFVNVEDCRLPEDQLRDLLDPYLGDDPVFGRIYKNDLATLYDLAKVKSLKARLSEAKTGADVGSQPRVIVCYGTGVLLRALKPVYDLKFYFDLTRETTLRRNKDWSELSSKTQSISPKKLYYVDMQVNDKHRNRLFNSLDYYVDGNNEGQPILLSVQLLKKTTSALASGPIRLKYMYEPGPWGGQWLKEIRHLPSEWVNCAWSFEVISTEMSLLAGVNGNIVEFPWTTFLFLQYEQVMGDVPKRRFRGEFPIRFDYLDTMDGGDLSIQVHPGTPYIRKNFNESYHQGEMYYIVDAKENASVNLGLKENANLEEFKQMALLAEEKGIKFESSDFVNRVPGKKHDLLMIPPGTIHGSGEGLVVLEISATTYRYTFKIYDYLRPDLNNVMRPIHIEHAFNVIKPFRRSKWVSENLIQIPSLVRSGVGWAEYLIGDRREFFHVVFRLEFDKHIEDDTCGKFHLLTLVEGDAVEIHALEDKNNKIEIKYSETVIIPAGLGKYQMTNKGQGVCKVVKARLR